MDRQLALPAVSGSRQRKSRLLASGDGPGGSLRSWKVASLFLLGSILLQGAWSLAIPPFMGNDEIDHAYRASEVARGDWGPPRVVAQHGVGELVRVPDRTVSAASDACQAVDYYGPDNCIPVARYRDGSVEIASSAARYSPVYYWLVGFVGKPFQGVAALYVMRAATIALCSSLFALSAYCVTRWARTSWPYVGLVAAMTPVSIYSGSVVAPNGVEIAAAVWLWAALFGIATKGSENECAALVRHAGLAAALLVLPRTLGPFWLATIGFTWAIAAGRVRLGQVVRAADWGARAAWGFAGTAIAWAIWWDLAAQPNMPSSTTNLKLGSPWHILPGQLPLWLLQVIAAFPRRHDAAPAPVYAIWLLLFAVLVFLALRKARAKRALLVALALGVLIPVAMTAPTYSAVGPVWQGRYGLPYLSGIAIASGWALDQSRGSKAPTGWTLWVGAAGIALAYSLSVVHAGQLAHSRLAGAAHSDLLAASHAWILTALTVAGCSIWLLGTVLARHLAEPSPSITG